MCLFITLASPDLQCSSGVVISATWMLVVAPALFTSILTTTLSHYSIVQYVDATALSCTYIITVNCTWVAANGMLGGSDVI